MNMADEYSDYDQDDYGTHYGEYAGTYAQDYAGYSDDVINMPLMAKLMLIGTSTKLTTSLHIIRIFATRKRTLT